MATRTPPSNLQQQHAQPATPHPSSNHQSHHHHTHSAAHPPPPSSDFSSTLTAKLHPATHAPKAAMGAVKTGFLSGVLGVDSAMRSSEMGRASESPAVSASRPNSDRLAPVGAKRAPLGESRTIHTNSHSPVTDGERKHAHRDDGKHDSKPLPHPPKIADEEDVSAMGVATPPQHTLSRPKSRLRLRLKLTPPHPPGTRVMEVPHEPVPSRPPHYNRVASSQEQAAANHTNTDEVVAGREYHYIRQQPSISTLNEHCFTRTSDVAASEADARTSKAMHQVNALTLVANNSPPSAVAAYRTVSGASAKGKSQYSSKPPPPAASQRKRETTMVKRMLSTDGLRGKAVEMGKSLFSSGHPSSGFDMIVPSSVTAGRKAKQASPPQAELASPPKDKETSPPKRKEAAPISLEAATPSKVVTPSGKVTVPYPTPPDSGASLEKSKADDASADARIDALATPRKTPPRQESLRTGSVSTVDGSVGPALSTASSSGPSCMELSMTMSNSSRSTVNPDNEAEVLDDETEMLDGSLLLPDRDISVEQPPRTPPRNKAAVASKAPEPAAEDVFYPASDATPVRSAKNVATGDISASTEWSDLTPSKSRQAASSATHSSPFTYDSEEPSGCVSSKHAGDVSGVTLASSQPSPLAKKSYDASNPVTDIFSVSCASSQTMQLLAQPDSSPSSPIRACPIATSSSRRSDSVRCPCWNWRMRSADSLRNRQLGLCVGLQASSSRPSSVVPLDQGRGTVRVGFSHHCEPAPSFPGRRQAGPPSQDSDHRRQGTRAVERDEGDSSASQRSAPERGRL